ncbi:hypothetical protein K402DRAFT_457934 [Aulographum hederae CBS 113979]|uniref:Uncharacterized protein n=1 Tax=Aulographum hederae CBS 113979 TaxID=1176131 RepID=A0A6G1GLJ2_9PEZI|nr:hypothetical protein K402DRAFT_457934 [Aulographum hederae CBS 113979]
MSIAERYSFLPGVHASDDYSHTLVGVEVVEDRSVRLDAGFGLGPQWLCFSPRRTPFVESETGAPSRLGTWGKAQQDADCAVGTGKRSWGCGGSGCILGPPFVPSRSRFPFPSRLPPISLPPAPVARSVLPDFRLKRNTTTSPYLLCPGSELRDISLPSKHLRSASAARLSPSYRLLPGLLDSNSQTRVSLPRVSRVHATSSLHTNQGLRKSHPSNLGTISRRPSQLHFCLNSVSPNKQRERHLRGPAAMSPPLRLFARSRSLPASRNTSTRSFSNHTHIVRTHSLPRGFLMDSPSPAVSHINSAVWSLYIASAAGMAMVLNAAPTLQEWVEESTKDGLERGRKSLGDAGEI